MTVGKKMCFLEGKSAILAAILNMQISQIGIFSWTYLVEIYVQEWVLYSKKYGL